MSDCKTHARGAYRCFHCGKESVGWNSDADFEDVGREDEGVVHFLTCSSCGAFITYEIPDVDPEGLEECCE